MTQLHIAVHGLGNIGHNALKALCATKDMRCLGVIRRAESLGTSRERLCGMPEFASLAELAAAHGQQPDVVLLCCPTRSVPEIAPQYLALGIHTVDSFDIHSEIANVVTSLDPIAKKAGASAIVGAGWDPGSNSILRALFEAMVPQGTSFTNFGPGKSMGHSVAAKAIPDVLDAISLTLPIGGGKHARLVYVLPAPEAAHEQIEKNIANDPYFINDPLEIRFVTSQEELDAVADNSHGVMLERAGASCQSANQRLRFSMQIDNPALTAQMLVSSARAASRLAAGCYTLIDIPPVSFLPGERLHHVARLV